ncbi:hypothetical protein MY3296_002455 [Beauveria thailandica]
MANLGDLRRAEVLWWDPENVYVLCPWCSRSHCHKFSEEYHHQLGDAPCRTSHCKISIYSIDYPVGQCDIGYEIDKKNCRYITKRGLEYQKGLLSDARREGLRKAFQKVIEEKQTWSATMEKSLFWEDAKEERKMRQDATVWRIDIVCFRMIQGDVKFVENFLESSSDAALLLHGVYSGLHSKQSARENGRTGFLELDQFTYGTTALHIAARGQYPEIVRLLVSKGAKIDAQDVNGYTPLMEAAFWGRLENARILLGHGANKFIECIHDGRLKTAQDLAENTRNNAWIRTRRAEGAACQPLVKDTYARDCDRDDIRHLLRRTIFKGPTVPAHLALQEALFGKDKETSQLLSLKTYYSIFDERKATAVLHRGPNFPNVYAMSGWGHDDERDKRFISGNKWTAKVLSLSRRLNLQLQPSVDDGPQVGRCEASHAVKQLIAYLIDRHWFRRDKMILPDEMDGLEESAADLHMRNSREIKSCQFGRLYLIKPEHGLKKAAIITNEPNCDGCRHFINFINGSEKFSELDLRVHRYSAIV